MDLSYKNLLTSLSGKTIAVVYIFEGETEIGYEHYSIWKSDVISSWINAISELKCKPYILDIRTFIFKSMNNSLPQIDYVINLNNGNIDLSTLGLVPSTCSFLGIDCIPCNTSSLVIGENKLLSNIIAYANNLKIPRELDVANPNKIIRPLSYGSSKGVSRTKIPIDTEDYICQEFITGFDTTTPIMYNPISNNMEVLPTILYCPNSKDSNWYLGEDAKKLHEGYIKKSIYISEKAKNNFIMLAKQLSINTFCRIDARIKAETFEELLEMIKQPISNDNLYFLEINPMPTISDGINFHTSIDSLDENFNFLSTYQKYYDLIDNPSKTGFILSNALLAKIRAKH